MAIGVGGSLKTQNGATIVPAVLLWGVYTKDSRSYHREICSSVFTVALGTIAKKQKQLRCPSTDDWVKKMHTHTLLFSHKEK